MSDIEAMRDVCLRPHTHAGGMMGWRMGVGTCYSASAGLPHPKPGRAVARPYEVLSASFQCRTSLKAPLLGKKEAIRSAAQAQAIS